MSKASFLEFLLLRSVPLLILAFDAGCSSALLVPNPIHAPLMEKKGNVRIEAMAGTNGGTASIAVSPEQNLAFRGSYQLAWNKTETISKMGKVDFSRGNSLGEFAVGYYIPSFSLAKKSGMLEFYIGFDDGRVRGGFDPGVQNSVVQDITAHARSYFVEVNTGIRERLGKSQVGSDSAWSAIEYGSSFRFSNWQLTGLTYNGIPAPSEKKQGNFMQATVFARTPARGICFEAQAGFLFYVSNHPDPPSCGTAFVALGFHFMLFP